MGRESYRAAAPRAKLSRMKGPLWGLDRMSWAEQASETGRLAGLRARELVRAAVEVVLPPQALDGARAAPPVQTRGLTAEAWSKITFIEAPVCDGCGAPQAYDAGDGARCAACLAAGARLRPGARRRPLRRGLARPDPEAEAGRPHRSRRPLRALARPRRQRPGRATPTSSSRCRCIRCVCIDRRFNQAAEIARPLARRAGLAYLPGALVRRRNTPSQGGRSGSGRRRNMAAAFAAPKRAWPQPRGQAGAAGRRRDHHRRHRRGLRAGAEGGGRGLRRRSGGGPCASAATPPLYEAPLPGLNNERHGRRRHLHPPVLRLLRPRDLAAHPKGRRLHRDRGRDGPRQAARDD